MSTPILKIIALNELEKEIIATLQSAGLVFQELSKDKPSQKTVETQARNFLTTLRSVENKLNEQITSLLKMAAIQPHEGTSYDSAKALQLGWLRMKHVRGRLRELEESKAKYTHASRQLEAIQKRNRANREAAAVAAMFAALQRRYRPAFSPDRELGSESTQDVNLNRNVVSAANKDVTVSATEDDDSKPSVSSAQNSAVQSIVLDQISAAAEGDSNQASGVDQSKLSENDVKQAVANEQSNVNESDSSQNAAAVQNVVTEDDGNQGVAIVENIVERENVSQEVVAVQNVQNIPSGDGGNVAVVQASVSEGNDDQNIVAVQPESES